MRSIRLNSITSIAAFSLSFSAIFTYHVYMWLRGERDGWLDFDLIDVYPNTKYEYVLGDHLSVLPCNTVCQVNGPNKMIAGAQIRMSANENVLFSNNMNWGWVFLQLHEVPFEPLSLHRNQHRESPKSFCTFLMHRKSAWVCFVHVSSIRKWRSGWALGLMKYGWKDVPIR